MQKKRAIVTGGGTGGHLYPALAIIEAISVDYDISYVGNPSRIEADVVPQKGIPFYAIPSIYLRSGLLSRAALALMLVWGTLKGFWLVLRLRPKLIIGVGGFVSVPMMLAGWIARRRLVLHEQNVGPGQANRFLGRIAKMPILTTFPVEKRHFPKNEMTVTGCPVRKSFWTLSKEESRTQLGLSNSNKVILIVGGSGGAVALNDAAATLCKLIPERPDLVLLHGTGRNYFDSVSQTRNALPKDVQERYRVFEYLDETAVFMSAADMIVSRSGASTLSEIFCSNLPSVLVPSPNVAENHQLANALFAQEANASVVLEEGPDFEARILKATTQVLDDDVLRSRMSDAAKQNCRGKDAGQKILTFVNALTAT